MWMDSVAYRYPEALVSTDWLAERTDDPTIRIFDCTTYLHYETDDSSPYRVVSGRADYNEGHIPNSAFLDLQGALSDKASPYRFTLPSVGDLAERFQTEGIGDGTRAVLYSRGNMQWATRIWWMLRWVGFDTASVLDGGWDKWRQETRPISHEGLTHPAAQFTARPRPELFVGKDTVGDAIGEASACILNALSEDLHSGENPRYGRPGRIPGSVNLPAANLQHADNRVFPRAADAEAAFARIGVDRSKRTIVYCGGGIAATLDAFLLYQLGFEDIAVYDNSMSEWAKDETLPIETD